MRVQSSVDEFRNPKCVFGYFDLFYHTRWFEKVKLGISEFSEMFLTFVNFQPKPT